MNNENKDAMIASVEAVEAIKEFLNGWYSVADMYETSAKASNELLQIMKTSCEDFEALRDLMFQHLMLADILKKIEKGGAEV